MRLMVNVDKHQKKHLKNNRVLRGYPIFRQTQMVSDTVTFFKMGF